MNIADRKAKKLDVLTAEYHAVFTSILCNSHFWSSASSIYIKSLNLIFCNLHGQLLLLSSPFPAPHPSWSSTAHEAARRRLSAVLARDHKHLCQYFPRGALTKSLSKADTSAVSASNNSPPADNHQYANNTSLPQELALSSLVESQDSPSLTAQIKENAACLSTQGTIGMLPYENTSHPPSRSGSSSSF